MNYNKLMQDRQATNYISEQRVFTTHGCGHYREEIIFKKKMKYLQNDMYQIRSYKNNLTCKYFVILQEDTKRI